ncbi:hypothetical protein HDU67_005357, partial [Dinochytrium kinnereticum]
MAHVKTNTGRDILQKKLPVPSATYWISMDVSVGTPWPGDTEMKERHLTASDPLMNAAAHTRILTTSSPYPLGMGKLVGNPIMGQASNKPIFFQLPADAPTTRTTLTQPAAAQTQPQNTASNPSVNSIAISPVTLIILISTIAIIITTLLAVIIALLIKRSRRMKRRTLGENGDGKDLPPLGWDSDANSPMIQGAARHVDGTSVGPAPAQFVDDGNIFRQGYDVGMQRQTSGRSMFLQN